MKPCPDPGGGRWMLCSGPRSVCQRGPCWLQWRLRQDLGIACEDIISMKPVSGSHPLVFWRRASWGCPLKAQLCWTWSWEHQSWPLRHQPALQVLLQDQIAQMMMVKAAEDMRNFPVTGLSQQHALFSLSICNHHRVSLSLQVRKAYSCWHWKHWQRAVDISGKRPGLNEFCLLSKTSNWILFFLRITLSVIWKHLFPWPWFWTINNSSFDGERIDVHSP